MEESETQTAAEASSPSADERWKWKPVIKVSSIIFGALFGIGVAVLRQQYGIAPLTLGAIILWIAIGLLLALAVPSAARAIAVWRHNKSLAPRPGGDH